MKNTVLSRGKIESSASFVTGQQKNFTCHTRFGCKITFMQPQEEESSLLFALLQQETLRQSNPPSQDCFQF